MKHPLGMLDYEDEQHWISTIYYFNVSKLKYTPHSNILKLICSFQQVELDINYM